LARLDDEALKLEKKKKTEFEAQSASALDPTTSCARAHQQSTPTLMLGMIALEPTPRVHSITTSLERHSLADEKSVEHLSDLF
jgi:hypothetical protein